MLGKPLLLNHMPRSNIVSFDPRLYTYLSFLDQCLDKTIMAEPRVEGYFWKPPILPSFLLLPSNNLREARGILKACGLGTK
jgi:hypothetical protein